MEELEKIVNTLELENSRAAAADPVVQESLKIVREFLTTHPVLCYGGTAINNLLPKEDRFYDPEFDIPDYDFFSRTPQEHAMILSNKLASAGIKNIEVKPGMHLGTFKVFADYEAVADITQLDKDIFDKLWNAGIEKENIHYVPPDFLRMSMYLELSRPRGDVSRWTKVYKRLLLLNKHYPIVCKQKEALEHDTITKQMKKEIVGILKNYPVVLLGVTAAEVHMKKEWTTPVMLLADKETIDILTKGKDIKVDEGSEILPPRTSIFEKDGISHIKFYETTACHSYHVTEDGIRVASIPTILQFFFAYIYSAATEANIASMMCIAQRLVDIAHSKPKRRFAILTPIDCIGKQETLTDMRKHKSILYEKLGKKKTSGEFLKYFFTYDPHAPKTQRQKIRNLLKRTRKVRTDTA
jgi:hypothetical protein